MLDRIGREGGTPLAVARDSQVLGVIYLKDTIKEGMRERFDHLRAMGIRTIMITGDNRLTAAKIAEESGVDDFLAEATPEKKLELIKEQQAQGRMVAMTGDGTNDAPALAQADVGVTMNTGTQAAREAGNMVDLDSNPTKLIEIVEVGKQLLITRGSLTTFSIANDVAKYFAILPAIFASTYAAAQGAQGPLHVLNIMSLGSPRSAVISAIIFNALIIPLLIPLALRGVRYRPIGADALLRRNLWIYGLGGIIAPFIGIKLIDLLGPQPTRRMRGAQVLVPARSARSPRCPKRRWEDRAVARVLAPRLDRELARGIPPWSSGAHAARAVQLTGDRTRRAMARSVERLIEDVEKPRSRFMSAVVSPCADQVRHAMPLILTLASRLRSAEPVNARGVAQLSRLLSDGGGPCYVRVHPEALTLALQQVSRWLDVDD